MHPDFKMPTEKKDLKKLGDEIIVAAVPLQNLKFTDKTATSCIRFSAVKRSIDLDSYEVIKEMDTEESSNRARALLARVKYNFYHL